MLMALTAKAYEINFWPKHNIDGSMLMALIANAKAYKINFLLS